MDTLISYLWGICLGSFLFSIVMILIFALPSILDKSSTWKVGARGQSWR